MQEHDDVCMCVQVCARVHAYMYGAPTRSIFVYSAVLYLLVVPVTPVRLLGAGGVKWSVERQPTAPPAACRIDWLMGVEEDEQWRWSRAGRQL